MTANVITFTAAAAKKNCARSTLYRAADQGKINTADVGGVRMILLDEHFVWFTPSNVGARVHRNRSRYGAPDKENTSE